MVERINKKGLRPKKKNRKTTHEAGVLVRKLSQLIPAQLSKAD